MTEKKTPTRKKTTKATKPPVYWGKGPKTEVVEYGGAKLTVRGLSYREFLYISSLDTRQSDIDSFRICVTKVENLLAVDEDGKEETLHIKYETINIDGKDTQAMTVDSYDIFDESILLIGQILHVIKELSRLTKEEASAARIFRQGK